jgi:hypothetical protein
MEQVFIMENSTEKRGRFLKMYGDKCQRIYTGDRDLKQNL